MILCADVICISETIAWAGGLSPMAHTGAGGRCARAGGWKAGRVSQRWTAREIVSAVRSGARTATEFTEHALAGVGVLDQVLYFIDSMAAGSALAAARRIDASPSGQRGALAGVPFLAKAGTSVASPVFGRLAAAGAVLLGTSTRPVVRRLVCRRGVRGGSRRGAAGHRGRFGRLAADPACTRRSRRGRPRAGGRLSYYRAQARLASRCTRRTERSRTYSTRHRRAAESRGRSAS